MPVTACRLAHQQGVLEEREQQELAVGQLSRRLADREGQVAHLHQQLQEVSGRPQGEQAGWQVWPPTRKLLLAWQEGQMLG